MIANILIGLVAAIHLYILVLEMVLWDKPAGRKAFGLSPEFASQSKTLAANQGLYNGFLAAGLIYGLLAASSGYEFKLFFLICVLVAGLFGGLTASKKILYVPGCTCGIGIDCIIRGNINEKTRQTPGHHKAIIINIIGERPDRFLSGSGPSSGGEI